MNFESGTGDGKSARGFKQKKKSPNSHLILAQQYGIQTLQNIKTSVVPFLCFFLRLRIGFQKYLGFHMLVLK
jgi:hypothetical protein